MLLLSRPSRLGQHSKFPVLIVKISIDVLFIALFSGTETDGLPDYAWRCLDAAVVIPIIERHVRSLNVSVAAGIGLYEAIRQIDSLGTSKPLDT